MADIFKGKEEAKVLGFGDWEVVCCFVSGEGDTAF